jgi:hypothetical protein
MRVGRRCKQMRRCLRPAAQLVPQNVDFENGNIFGTPWNSHQNLKVFFLRVRAENRLWGPTATLDARLVLGKVSQKSEELGKKILAAESFLIDNYRNRFPRFAWVGRGGPWMRGPMLNSLAAGASAAAGTSLCYVVVELSSLRSHTLFTLARAITETRRARASQVPGNGSHPKRYACAFRCTLGRGSRCCYAFRRCIPSPSPWQRNSLHSHAQPIQNSP